MKFYYNGHLVRTSEHEYTHGVYDTRNDKVVACRNGLDKAEAAKRDELRLTRQFISSDEELVKALKAGRTWFFDKVGGRSYRCRINPDETVEKAEARIAERKAWIETRNAELVIVPLEKR